MTRSRLAVQPRAALERSADAEHVHDATRGSSGSQSGGPERLTSAEVTGAGDLDGMPAAQPKCWDQNPSHSRTKTCMMEEENSFSTTSLKPSRPHTRCERVREKNCHVWRGTSECTSSAQQKPPQRFAECAVWCRASKPAQAECSRGGLGNSHRRLEPLMSGCCIHLIGAEMLAG